MPLTAAKTKSTERRRERGDMGAARVTSCTQGPGVEAGGHDHAEGGPGEEPVVLPGEKPAFGGALLAGGRQALAREVDGLEIGAQGQLEVGDLLDVVAEAVPPLFQPLRFIGNADLAALARPQLQRLPQVPFRQRQRGGGVAVDGQGGNRRTPPGKRAGPARRSGRGGGLWCWSPYSRRRAPPGRWSTTAGPCGGVRGLYRLPMRLASTGRRCRRVLVCSVDRPSGVRLTTVSSEVQYRTGARWNWGVPHSWPTSALSLLSWRWVAVGHDLGEDEPGDGRAGKDEADGADAVQHEVLLPFAL